MGRASITKCKYYNCIGESKSNNIIWCSLKSGKKTSHLLQINPNFPHGIYFCLLLSQFNFLSLNQVQLFFWHFLLIWLCAFYIQIMCVWKEISAKNLHTYIFYYPFSPHIWRSSQILFIIFSSSLRRGIFISLAHCNKPCTYANVYTYVKTF